MLQRFQASLVLLICLASFSAAAQEPADDGASEEKPAPTAPPPPPPAPAAAVEVKPATEPSPWHIDVNGYFRAPAAMGVSSRPGPDDMNGPSKTQVSYGPNRTFDSNYYSFAYTRLQEQDWAEVFIHARKKHVDAAVGWMGYWFQSVGFRNYDAAWAPGLAYVALDTDFKVFSLEPNISLTAGAWWPGFGYFEKYDTYTLGRFRQLGVQPKLTVPFNPDYTLTVVGGFGTNRDGTFNPGSPPFYGAIVGLDLMTWVNVSLAYQKYVDVALHYSVEWTSDPNLTQQSTPDPKSFMEAQLAHLTVAGLQANVHAPHAGRFWVSPSIVSVRNGWALASAGTEVMHSLGGAGVATNYFAWTGSPSDSTGSGSMFNLGLLYENSLSNLLFGTPLGSVRNEVTFSAFALLAEASLDLPAGSMVSQYLVNNNIKQMKYGLDASIQALPWLGFMLRWDEVNYDLDKPAYVFATITQRATISSHFLSSERIYFQYSRYIYGDKVLLNGTWPWGQSLVAGSSVLQEGPYAGKKPDENVVKIQAEIAF
jgi:hypothetical protein